MFTRKLRSDNLHRDDPAYGQAVGIICYTLTPFQTASKFRFSLSKKNIAKLIYEPGKFINQKREQYPGTVEISDRKQKIEMTSGITSNVEKEWLAHELSEWLNIPITQEQLFSKYEHCPFFLCHI